MDEDDMTKRAAMDEEASPEVDKKPAAAAERPLIRTTNVSTAIISLYRLMIFIRVAIFALFFKWRITQASCTGNTTGIWTVSIIGEIWFALMWLFDQLPKIKPVRRIIDIMALNEKYESTSYHVNGISKLPMMDVFVTTADPEMEPPLTTVNTILSILAMDYPADKLTCYLSDDSGTLLTYEAIAEAARFAALWVPFCRKHNIEPRNPEVYFGAKMIRARDYKGRAWTELLQDRRRVRREYEELRLRINALPNAIWRWSNVLNAQMEYGTTSKVVGATRMADGSHWPGTWIYPAAGHSIEDHAGIVQVLLSPPSHMPQLGVTSNLSGIPLDLNFIDMRLPALIYVSREKRPDYHHNKKAGALNALLRASAMISNAPFLLNLDCDHYVNNSQALRAGACFMLNGCNGNAFAFVQYPQRFDGVDPTDRYANHNRVFFDSTEIALDGLQGPIYVGTGCLFRRAALYDIDPPCWRPNGDARVMTEHNKFGNSTYFIASIRAAVNQEWCNTTFVDKASITEAIVLVSCKYEDRTTWGRDIGWIYRTVTEDVVTGFCMHRRGWSSAYCIMNPDAFRGTAPINLTERLYQVLRWAAGSLEIFFSHNNVLLAGHRLHPMQRIAYLNTTVYPLTSLFLLLYSLFPVVPLLTGQGNSIDRPPSATYVAYLAALMLTLLMAAILEVRWSGITLGEWWRNEQFWMIAATSAYLAAVLHVVLKLVAGKEISFRLTSKQQAIGTNKKDEFVELYTVRWTTLMIAPSMILVVNIASIAVRMGAAMDAGWSKSKVEFQSITFGLVFNVWVLVHLYPFALGLMGQWGKSLVVLQMMVAFLTIQLLWHHLYACLFK